MISLKKAALASLCTLAALGAASHANAAPITITGISSSTFTSLLNCDSTGSSVDCAISTSGGNPQVKWGSTNSSNLHNPSTLTAPASLAFSGATSATLTIGKLDWFNSATLASETDSNFNVNWNLTVAFSTPVGSTGDTETFALNILNTPNPLPDNITNFTLADLSNLSFSIPGVTVSNFQYHVTDGSGSGTSSLTCGVSTCNWFNAESNNSTLTITADFTANHVPEPASLALLGLGLVGTGAMARRRRQSTTTAG